MVVVVAVAVLWLRARGTKPNHPGHRADHPLLTAVPRALLLFYGPGHAHRWVRASGGAGEAAVEVPGG